MEDTGRPYSQKIKDGFIYRIFSENTSSEELKWHKDQYDRSVTILKSNGWFFQRDNEMPFELKEGSEIDIPKETWHRIIKGSGDLVVKIKEHMPK